MTFTLNRYITAQSPLEFFTGQANALLQAEFGFGVTNMPVYSTTNPAIGYSASIHYQLQAAANAYDATTPATNFPSVFRPLCSWQGNTLFVVGYTCVTTDFFTQTSSGFKALTDPTITTNDNVWGIPWVIGAKGQIPAFNEYSYSSSIFVERQLVFVRYPNPNQPGQYITNRPPQYTNQFYIFSISNLFGADAWNFYSSPYTNSVTLILTNLFTITMTNNYNYGMNMVITNSSIDLLPEWESDGFVIPSFDNFISLPPSYWSESTQQFVTFTNDVATFLPNDLQQTGWPVHEWTINITNNLMYALVDTGTGHVLDFVNLGAFGSSFNVNQTLSNYSNMPEIWTEYPANDEPDSRLSEGAIYQIDLGFEEPGGSASLLFYNSLNGLSPDLNSHVQSFSPPFGSYGIGSQPSPPAAAGFIQSCTWEAGNPLVHYTIEDLTNSQSDEVIPIVPIEAIDDPLTIPSLGTVNPNYNCGAVENASFNFSDGLFQLGFSGAVDLPYEVWASTNVLDWCQIGTASQPSPGVFEFEDLAATNYPARFYQVRLP